jgi:thiamine biosynthesis lipoprotein
VRYSHIVDPATGLGLARPTAVTVVAQHATLADALATACNVLAPAAARQLADHSAESVRVIVHQRNADGSTQSTAFGHAPAGLISTP